MADALGLSALAAFLKDVGEDGVGGVPVYPQTPVDGDLGANSLIPFTGESFTLNLEGSMDPALVGSHAATPPDVVKIQCPGDVNGRLRFVGWERLFLCAMGFELEHTTNGSPADVGSGGYAHLLEMDDTLQDMPYLAGERETFHADDRKVRRGQLGLAKGVEDWILGSTMFNKFNITGNSSETNVSFGGMAYNLYRGDYSSDTWTEKSGTIAQSLFQNMVVKLALRTDTPGSMTTIGVSEYEINVENNLDGDTITTSSAPYIEIPVRDNFKDVTLKLVRPRFNSTYDDTMIDNWQQHQEMSAIITITGPLIGGSIYYKYKFCFPSLYPIGSLGFNIEGPGPLAGEWNFRAFRNITTDPFAATEYESISVIKDCEMRMMIYNTENVNYLTEL